MAEFTTTDAIANVNARQDAEAIHGLCEDSLASNPARPVNVARYWETLAKLAADKAELEVVAKQPPDDREEPMSEDERARLGRQHMEFGMYRNDQIRSIPSDYLEWLADEQTQFSRKLRRYLRSR